MRHSIVRKNLSAYLDKELPPDKSQEIADHLESCDSCPRRLQQILQGMTVTGYFENPQWHGKERVWNKIQRRRAKFGEKATEQSTVWRMELSRRFIGLRPAFAVAILALLLFANTLVYFKSQRFQYQRAQINWIPSYAIDFSLFLDALVQGEPTADFDKRYESEISSYDRAGSKLPFKLASFTGLPESFQLREVRLLKSACCRSVQFICQKNQKYVIIFQQPSGHPLVFGNYRLERLEIAGRSFHRVKAGRWTALNWEGLESQFVAVGELNEADLAAIVQAVTPI